jgi:hypothetical protein
MVSPRASRARTGAGTSGGGRGPTRVSVGRFLGASVALHVALALGGRAIAPVRTETFPRERVALSFALTVEALEPPERAIGLGEDGLEAERTSGLASGEDRGRAGDAFEGSAPSVHRAGADPRDRFAGGVDEVRALTGWVAEGLDASEDGRSPFDATSALGARDDASLGVRGSSRVAPGERGLDMIGTGRGSCPPGEDCAAGTIGDTTLGIGALGAAPRLTTGFAARGRSVRSLCITDTACAYRARHGLVIAIEVHGALTEDVVRRTMARHRAAIARCLVARPPARHGPERMELFVAPDGHVARVVIDDCLEALAGGLALPPASGPSIVIVRASFPRTGW